MNLWHILHYRQTLISKPKIKQAIKLLLLFLISFFFLSSLQLSAQIGPDEQLAAQYYQNKEFDKALVYYEKLFNKNPLPLYYNYYLNCLLETKDFKKAEKLVKKQIKQNSERLNFIVDLGTVYSTSGEIGKSKEQFDRAIKELTTNQESIFNLAKAFIAIRELDYAIETYKKGRKLLRNMYPFSFELAEVYAAKGNTVAMINEYLDVLEINDSYIQSVQNALQTNVWNNQDSLKNTILKTELLKRIQGSSDKPIFSELLIWILIQQKDFESAFVQSKALDKRKKENGERIMSLAQLCVSNENYDMAIKAYQYILSKGTENSNYASARMEILNTMYKKVVNQNKYTSNELIELEKNYVTTINELGKNANTISLIKNLAHLQAFYLEKTEASIALLEEAIQIPRIVPLAQAECKLELGDILLMSGDIWEASLNYSQVEKAFKYDAIGQEAKYRNAKISYYTGDFKWAQAQLDVLKGATSKLIANDALDLSLLITDNTGIDTNTAPLLLFSQADLLAFQNKDSEAITLLDSILVLFPAHTLADDILMKKSQLMLKKGKYEEAATFLQGIISNYSYDILADDALFKLAELNETHFNNTEKAKELYQEILTKYPGSMFSVEARKRFRLLRKDVVN